MKLLTFGPPRAEQPGVLADDGTILPLAGLLEDFGLPPNDVNALLGTLPLLRPAIEDALSDSNSRISTDGVRLGPPVPRPRKLMVIGGNYWSHVEEMRHLTGGKPPKLPIIVFKPSTNVIGPYDSVVRPPETTQLDYEAELGLVIGRGGRRIPADRAYEHVAGYMNVDDTGAREVMMGEVREVPMHAQPTRGKGFDTFCPSGPYLVTADEVSDPMNLRIRKWVNGELRQDSSTSDMVIDLAGLVADASNVMRLLPGDVFLTGTPSGCGAAQEPPVFLQPGDVVRQEIGGDGVSLGVMETTVVDEVI
jgi:2-keto-4-pentenoate hydratase/2-oxohepta-3-ene-1,7-dioic acid hydratase in catechol pathway